MDDLELLDDPAARDALLAVIAHVAFADGRVQPDEFVYLQQLVPREDPYQLLARVTELAGAPLDLGPLARALPDEARRWKALRFAARMAWMDSEVTSGETAILTELARVLSMPAGAVAQVVAELIGRGGPLAEGGVPRALDGMVWQELAFVRGPSVSALGRVVPEGAGPFGVVMVDGIEQIVVCESGLAAGFREGDAWVPWADVQAWTRVPVFGAAVRIQTPEGTRTLVDPRLRPVGALLDRVFGLAWYDDPEVLP